MRDIGRHSITRTVSPSSRVVALVVGVQRRRASARSSGSAGGAWRCRCTTVMVLSALSETTMPWRTCGVPGVVLGRRGALALALARRPSRAPACGGASARRSRRCAACGARPGAPRACGRAAPRRACDALAAAALLGRQHLLGLGGSRPRQGPRRRPAPRRQPPRRRLLGGGLVGGRRLGGRLLGDGRLGGRLLLGRVLDLCGLVVSHVSECSRCRCRARARRSARGRGRAWRPRARRCSPARRSRAGSAGRRAPCGPW